MYIVKYLENSDAACEAVVNTFGSLHEAQEYMAHAYSGSLNLFGAEKFADKEDDSAPEEFQRWASINDCHAHIQYGIDSFDWEITEDANFAPTPQYVVTGTVLNVEDGRMMSKTPKFAYSKDEANTILREMYNAAMEKLRLKYNGACDKEEVSLNGGCICENEATIWGYTKYSPDFLMDIASFCIFPIGEKKDPPDGKKDESVV